MRSRHVHDPDFSGKRGCVWGPGLTLLLFVLIIVGVLVGLYRWSRYLGATAVAAFVAFIATSPWRAYPPDAVAGSPWKPLTSPTPSSALNSMASDSSPMGKASPIWRGT